MYIFTDWVWFNFVLVTFFPNPYFNFKMSFYCRINSIIILHVYDSWFLVNISLLFSKQSKSCESISLLRDSTLWIPPSSSNLRNYKGSLLSRRRFILFLTNTACSSLLIFEISACSIQNTLIKYVIDNIAWKNLLYLILYKKVSLCVLLVSSVLLQLTCVLDFFCYLILF